jgi:hypothetical protein
LAADAVVGPLADEFGAGDGVSRAKTAPASPLGSEIDIGASRAAWNNTVQANSDDPSMTGMFRTAYLPVITATSRQARERTPNEPPASPLRLT